MVAVKFAGAAVSTTRFTTNVSRAAARAATSAGVVSVPKGEATNSGKPAGITAASSQTRFTSKQEANCQTI
ncbi:hypothetical protein IWW35_001955 [Coemansia sp. RSA 1878]|nr:hypothetical protein IWW35_001955 [Coemansia sp. RSA 1878]